jgi:transposase
MAMTIVEAQTWVSVGVDTHRDNHVAAVLDERGGQLGVESFSASTAGYQRLERWALGFGAIDAVGVEGSGSWGAGLARHLIAAGHRVVDVDRPDRKTRRRDGKSDTIDAIAAASAVQAGTATGTPKARTGTVEALRVLRIVSRSAMKARTQAANQLHALVATAPDELRSELRALKLPALVARCVGFRPGDLCDPTQATKKALRTLARRHQTLTVEIDDHKTDEAALVAATPTGARLLALYGVGPDTAGQLLVTAGDNPQRLATESSFAHLCGVAPLPASSGTTTRHRLNRGGDRQANCALYRIVLVRLSHDPRTRHYMQRRTEQGHTTKEIIRCLKRYVAREIHLQLTQQTP